MNEERLLSLLTSDEPAVRAQGREIAAALAGRDLGARVRLVLSAYAWVAHARAEEAAEGNFREWRAPFPPDLPDRIAPADAAALTALLPPYAFGESATVLAPGLDVVRRHAGKWGGNVHTIAWQVSTYPIGGEGIVTRVLWPDASGVLLLRRITVRLK